MKSALEASLPELMQTLFDLRDDVDTLLQNRRRAS
jgi:hypothetical protein